MTKEPMSEPLQDREAVDAWVIEHCLSPKNRDYLDRLPVEVLSMTTDELTALCATIAEEKTGVDRRLVELSTDEGADNAQRELFLAVELVMRRAYIIATEEVEARRRRSLH